MTHSCLKECKEKDFTFYLCLTIYEHFGNTFHPSPRCCDHSLFIFARFGSTVREALTGLTAGGFGKQTLIMFAPRSKWKCKTPSKLPTATCGLNWPYHCEEPSKTRRVTKQIKAHPRLNGAVETQHSS